MLKSKVLKKVGASFLAAVSALSMLTVGGMSTVSAATTTDYDSIQSVVFNIHKGELDEETSAADNEGKIGNTRGLTGTTADAPANFKGIAGATFKMYKVAGINETIAEDKTDAEKIDEAVRIRDSRNIEGKTLPATNSNGLASITIPRADFGLYLVEEVTPAPDAVTTLSAKFLVYLPMTVQNDTNKQGKEWLTQVDVYPKNLVTLGGAVLTKTINTAAYDETALQTQPEFKLVEIKSDGSEYVIAENIALSNGYKVVPLTATAAADKRFVTTTISQKAGKIAVDGLPTYLGDAGEETANYQFVETKAGRLVGDTKDLAMDTTPRKFSVKRGNNVDVVTANTAAFGTYTGNAAGLTVELSNDNSRTPEIKKEVQKRDGSWTEGDGGTWSIDTEDVIWKVTADIPADMETYKKYTITDKIDSKLDFVLSDTSVVVDKGLGLAKGADYTIAYNQSTRTLTVDVTASGCRKLGAFDYKSKDFVFTITTQINSTAVVDSYINNSAKIDFKNSYDFTGTENTPNNPKVRTGGLNILKVTEDNNQPMKGVEFTLKDHTGTAVPVTKVSEGYYVVDATSKSSTVVTDANGKIFVKGLHYTEGDVSVYTEAGKNQYTLTETKTNNEYQLLTEPVKVVVKAGTYDEANALTIENTHQSPLPLTGGVGTILFTVGGLALIGIAGFLFVASRKRKAQEQ